MEYRIVKTYLSGRPPYSALMITLLTWSVIVLMSHIFWQNWFGLTELLPVSKPTLFEQGQVWRAWTAIFIHGDLGHLLSNSLFFLLFGYLIYGYFGPILFPWGTLLGAATTNFITIAFYPPFIRLVGASGWVYVLAGTWLTLFFLIERRLTIPGRIIRFIGISLVLLIPETFRHEVSYLSHGVGFVVGLVIALIFFHFNKEWIRKHERIRYWDPDPEGDTQEFDPTKSQNLPQPQSEHSH